VTVLRYGPSLYWKRDDASGTWHSTTDFPPGASDVAMQPPKTAQLEAAAGKGVCGEYECVCVCACVCVFFCVSPSWSPKTAQLEAGVGKGVCVCGEYECV
jgi:hypothetical protein